ncbi:MAG: glycosyltransferase [Candidatus Hodarchaeales archaeon]
MFIEIVTGSIGGTSIKILIGIPLFNEQAYLSECIISLYDYLDSECKNYDIDVLLLDDGSTDKSKEIYTELKQKYPLKTALHEDGPLGYGYSILTLFREAKKEYDILITFDADLHLIVFGKIIQKFQLTDTLQICILHKQSMKYLI